MKGPGVPRLADGMLTTVRGLSTTALEQCKCWEESGLGNRFWGVQSICLIPRTRYPKMNIPAEYPW